MFFSWFTGMPIDIQIFNYNIYENNMNNRISFIALILLSIGIFSCQNTDKPQEDTKTETTEKSGEIRGVWSMEQANEWKNKVGWLRGANFQPSTAINQLEMWQETTFDPETMDRELGWAEDIGFNAMRVYLHHVAWEVDKKGFKDRVSQYLEIADKHGIKTIFVFFDDCWNPTYEAGLQPKPKTGVHNSGWVRDPGQLIFDKPELTSTLELYVKDILTHFANDRRIVLWDLYNEPGNSGYGNKSMPLLKDVFRWARQINPSQPLSAGVWNLDLKDLNDYQVAYSDIITYHNYGDKADHQKWIDMLKVHNRPMVCTEYMARTNNSFFKNIMPMLKENHIGAINWGLVSGKTNTIYAWNTPMPDGKEPELWFHDIFRKDGTPYKQKEVDLIRELTSE